MGMGSRAVFATRKSHRNEKYAHKTQDHSRRRHGNSGKKNDTSDAKRDASHHSSEMDLGLMNRFRGSRVIATIHRSFRG
jgi:hypothetical protein